MGGEIMFNTLTVTVILQHLLKLTNEYKYIKKEIEKYNRKDTVNMSPLEMNRFRHIAASAYFITQGFSKYEVELLGNLKEISDFARKFSWTDSNFDINNNKKGIQIGEKFKHKKQKELFDYIFKNEIAPRRH